MYKISNVSSLISTENTATEMKQYVAFVLLHYICQQCFYGGFMSLATKGLHICLTHFNQIEFFRDIFS
jgi:hypothetical protein